MLKLRSTREFLPVLCLVVDLHVGREEEVVRGVGKFLVRGQFTKTRFVTGPRFIFTKIESQQGESDHPFEWVRVQIFT